MRLDRLHLHHINEALKFVRGNRKAAAKLLNLTSAELNHAVSNHKRLRSVWGRKKRGRPNGVLSFPVNEYDRFDVENTLRRAGVTRELCDMVTRYFGISRVYHILREIMKKEYKEHYMPLLKELEAERTMPLLRCSPPPEDDGQFLPEEVVRVPESLQASPEFVAAWKRWLDHLINKMKPLTSSAMSTMLANCAKIGPARAAAAIERSIARNYESIWESKEAAMAAGATHQMGEMGMFVWVPPPEEVEEKTVTSEGKT